MNTAEVGLVAIDANVLDKAGDQRDSLVDRFLALVSDGTLNVIITGSVRKEFEHPRTPGQIRDAPLPRTFDPQKGLSAAQHISRIRVRAILRGNARPRKHEADAAHLSEAAESGCAYFITHDGRMLRRRDDLHASVAPALRIVTLAEFLSSLEACRVTPAGPDDRAEW